MKVRWALLGGDDGDVVRQRRVDRLGRALGRRSAFDVDADHVSDRVHARVGATGDGKCVDVAKDGAERRLQDAFDSPQPRLRRPAVELGAVVLER